MEGEEYGGGLAAFWNDGAGRKAWARTGGYCLYLLLTVTTCSLRVHLSGPLAQLLVSPGAGLR